MGAIHKVKAHAFEEQVANDESLRLSKVVNALADHYAKVGALAHEKPSPEQGEWLEKCITIARKVYLLAARMLPFWPACDLSNATRVKVELPLKPARIPH
eukprot:4790320-Pyramimonas_sp.AAC.1